MFRVLSMAAAAAFVCIFGAALSPADAQNSCRPVQDCYDQPQPPRAIPYEQRVCYQSGRGYRCEMQTRYNYQEWSKRICKTRTVCSGHDVLRRVNPRK